jgi:hypothetical protein
MMLRAAAKEREKASRLGSDAHAWLGDCGGGEQALEEAVFALLGDDGAAEAECFAADRLCSKSLRRGETM